MGIKYEVTAKTGSYTDKQGNEKNRYMRLGVVMETKSGLALKIEGIPVNWDGWAYLNEPQEKQAPANAKADRPNENKPAEDDDIPW